MIYTRAREAKADVIEGGAVVDSFKIGGGLGARARAECRAV